MSTLSDDLATLSYEAAVYFYPLVTMDVTRRQNINTPEGTREGFGPPNRFHHFQAFPDADFRAVVRPNFDSLLSQAWLDLTAGPVIVHAPDTDDRYYLLPMLDMWSDVFAVPGKRTTGTAAQDFVITPPGYSGDVPSGLPVIAAPTPYVWIIGRTQTNGPADYAAVHRIQDGYQVTDLVSRPAHAIDPDYDIKTEPLRVVNSMSSLDFLAYGTSLMAVNPPHATDFSQLARLAGLGITVGQPFNPSRFDTQQRADIDAGWNAALTDLAASIPTLGKQVNNWTILTDTTGVYGNSYFVRAAVAMIGLGANQPEDAIYPLVNADADGRPLTGDNGYVIHFDADELPPVAAFWSVTMYDAEGFQAANELNRFAIGDRDDLRYNADGSLDLYLQHTNPGPGRQSNWLPAPLGPLGVTMRLYGPKAEALNGKWAPPLVHRAFVGASPTFV